MEGWRDVPGFEDELYQICLTQKGGKCRKLFKGGTEHLLNDSPNKNGYILWHLRKNGTEYCKQAAVWIAITYPELVQNEYFEGAEIDHIIPLSAGGTNHPSNLRWVTRTGNINNPLTIQHRIEAQHKKPVYQYNLSGELLKEYSGIREAARQTGLNVSNISKCCHGKQSRKTLGGYRWSFKKEAE